MWKSMTDVGLTIQSSDQSLPWLSRREEGELAVDVFETETAVFVKTAIAGVKPEDLELSLSHDMLTIRGRRHEDQDEEEKNYLCRECHFGPFSRSIILPGSVRADKTEATFQGGILLIKLPKIKEDATLKVKVKE